jgi:adenosylcobinamide-GDP ribazoletransferase
MLFVPAARADGLSAHIGRPPSCSVVVATSIAAGALVISLGLTGAVVALLLLSCAGLFMGWLSVKQIGGQTGDVLGALEQRGAVVILLTAAALYRSWSP